MMTPATHPSTGELAAFALGKLDPGSSTILSTHITSCSTCKRFVENTSPASLLAIWRNSKIEIETNPVGNTPSKHRSGTKVPIKAELSPLLPDVPAELQSHPRYEIVRELGRGGMGVVYLARHKLMDREVAIKLISDQLMDRNEVVQRFLREMKAVASLDHENIGRAYDAEIEGSVYMLILEYIDGLDLAKLVKKNGPFSIADACNYARQTALGLQHAFERAMVHRDLKPQNLMLTRDHKVKILDFGLFRLTSEQKDRIALTGENDVMGTPFYLPPEQARDARHADIRSDIYSLGCTLFHLLTGRPPFLGENSTVVLLKHQLDPPPWIRDLHSEVPHELAEIILRMMAKDPSHRPQTPAEVAKLLKPFLTHRGRARGWNQATSEDTDALPVLQELIVPEIEPSPEPPSSRRSRMPRLQETPRNTNPGKYRPRLEPLPPDREATPPPLPPSALRKGLTPKPKRFLWVWLLLLLTVAGTGAGLWFGGVFKSKGTSPVIPNPTANYVDPGGKFRVWFPDIREPVKTRTDDLLVKRPFTVYYLVNSIAQEFSVAYHDLNYVPMDNEKQQIMKEIEGKALNQAGAKGTLQSGTIVMGEGGRSFEIVGSVESTRYFVFFVGQRVYRVAVIANNQSETRTLEANRFFDSFSLK